jgi:hypothetical protein
MCVVCCDWCTGPMATKSPTARFCSRLCRQAAWRIRRRHQVEATTAVPLRMAYADPPYPKFAGRLYRQNEVDHVELLSLLEQYDGWALSTGAYALREILPLCPATAKVCAWVKPIGAAPATYGIHNTWEPLIVVPGRRLQPGKRDWLAAQPARRGGDLPGRKPLAFAGWLFELLGLLPGDELADLFPGSGIIGRSWSEVSRTPA